jgi:hypothetical protein
MHLFRAALAASHRQAQQEVQGGGREEEGESGGGGGGDGRAPPSPPRPRLIYFEQPTEFPEVKQLVADTAQQYALDMRTYANVGFAQGLRACIEGEGGGALAFLLGTRKVGRKMKRRGAFGFVLRGAGNGRKGVCVSSSRVAHR